MTEHGRKGTDKDCTLMCVRGGSSYVFVSEGRVLKIANQAGIAIAAIEGVHGQD
jgi:hypothetical protein